MKDRAWPEIDLFWASPQTAPQWSSATRRTAAPHPPAGDLTAHARTGMSQGLHRAPAPLLGVDLPALHRSAIPDTFRAR